MRNTVSDIVPFRAGEAVGVSINSTPEKCIVEENFIKLDQPHDQGRYIGIWVGGRGQPDSVAKNVIVNVDYSVAYTRLSGLAADNWIHERCADGWNSTPEKIDTFKSENHVLQSGRCSDDIDYLSQKLKEEPDAPQWYLRYATAVRQKQGKVVALPSYERACELGAEEGCRLADIYQKQIDAGK
ncbi:hypothetical protein AWJ14_17330 [Hoeflea olei]|uniref:Uncharacterized protein n=1 Tax=Hoeflea olei TaxID=1480615 RepID=A0A1C1YT38_9HYPH|nr:hypothetical protein AWJ14_17330 [Hoeflea olei]